MASVEILLKLGSNPLISSNQEMNSLSLCEVDGIDNEIHALLTEYVEDFRESDPK
jgi:hypothetical protein